MDFFKALLRTTLEGACQTLGGEIAKTSMAWIEKKTGRTFLVKDELPALTEEEIAENVEKERS